MSHFSQPKSGRSAQLWAVWGLLCLLPAVGWAQPWRYVDRRGNVHYTSNFDELPKAEQEKLLAKYRAEEAAAPGTPTVAPAPIPADPEEAGKPLDAARRNALKGRIAEARRQLVRLERRALVAGTPAVYAEKRSVEEAIRAMEAELARGVVAPVPPPEPAKAPAAPPPATVEPAPTKTTP